MQLSLLNLTGVLHRDVFSQENGPPRAAKRQRPESVTMYRCPECAELHEWEDDAEDCCKENSAPTAHEDHEKYACFCPVCGEKSADALKAADCCLWKDIDYTTRREIAMRVEQGSTWARELGVWPPMIVE